MTMELSWAVDILKQVPALVVLVILVTKFMSYLKVREQANDGRDKSLRALIQEQGDKYAKTVNDNTAAMAANTSAMADLKECVRDLKLATVNRQP